MGMSMCKNQDCESRNSCYRFIRTPNPFRQAYVDFAPANDEIACDMFIRAFAQTEQHTYDDGRN